MNPPFLYVHVSVCLCLSQPAIRTAQLAFGFTLVAVGIPMMNNDFLIPVATGILCHICTAKAVPTISPPQSLSGAMKTNAAKSKHKEIFLDRIAKLECAARSDGSSGGTAIVPHDSGTLHTKYDLVVPVGRGVTRNKRKARFTNVLPSGAEFSVDVRLTSRGEKRLPFWLLTLRRPKVAASINIGGETTTIMCETSTPP